MNVKVSNEQDKVRALAQPKERDAGDDVQKAKQLLEQAHQAINSALNSTQVPAAKSKLSQIYQAIDSVIGDLETINV